MTAQSYRKTQRFKEKKKKVLAKNGQNHMKEPDLDSARLKFAVTTFCLTISMDSVFFLIQNCLSPLQDEFRFPGTRQCSHIRPCNGCRSQAEKCQIFTMQNFFSRVCHFMFLNIEGLQLSVNNLGTGITLFSCSKKLISGNFSRPQQWRIQTFTDGGANRELGLSMLCLSISYCGKPILSLLQREKFGYHRQNFFRDVIDVEMGIGLNKMQIKIV